MKASEQYFPVVLFIILYKVVPTFELLDIILKCDHSNDLRKPCSNQWLTLSFFVFIDLVQFGFQTKDATTPVDFHVKHRKNVFFLGFHIVRLVFLDYVHCSLQALCNCHAIFTPFILGDWKWDQRLVTPSFNFGLRNKSFNS